MSIRCGDYVRSLIKAALIVCFIALTWIGGFSPNSSYKRKRITESSASPVVLYAGRQFHDEIAASMACLLHELGYTVVVYLYSDMAIGGFSMPFPDRIDAGKAHYGRCVHDWVYITPYSKLDFVPVAIVFVSYPMKTGHHTVDTAAYGLLQQVQSYDTKVVLVTHQAKESMWKHASAVEKYIPRDKMTFLFLSEHTYHTASQLQHNTPIKYRLAYLYPTVPLHMLFDEDKTADFASHRAQRDDNTISFAIQGNFGGQHDKRRNVPETQSCLHNLPHPMKSSMTKGETTSTRTNSAAEHHNKYTLNLVGKGSRKHATNTSHIEHVKVHKTGELNAPSFYEEIARSDFLVTSLGGDLYLHRQATSTIPTALILGVPVLTTRAVLELYPCLRDARVLRSITHSTECESIYHVVSLSSKEYMNAEDEIKNCSAKWWIQAKNTMFNVLNDMS